MFKNYIKIAVRNITRQKGYSFINITGLAIGLAVCILLFLWVQDELSFDKYHEKAQRIYRVGSQYQPAISSRGVYTAPPMAKVFVEEYPEILQAVRISPWQRNRLVAYKEKSFLEKGIMYADASLFDVFTIPFLHGDPKTALKKPGTIVLTKDMASKYFGEENPLGKTLKIDNREKEYLITGVVENCPANSHLQYRMIASLSTSKKSFSNSWMSHCYFTYIVLPEGYDPAELEARFPEFVKKHYGVMLKGENGISVEEFMKDKDNYYGYWLQPLSDIHLNARYSTNLKTRGNIIYIYVFSIIALFILLIACINFMNLATARAARRAGEVGLRKVMGASKPQLIRQFLSESVLFSMIAFVLALIFVEAVLPLFNTISGKQLEFGIFSDIQLFLSLLGITLLVGLMAGSYPALFLSSFQPAIVLKGKINANPKGKWLRSGLVVFQFSISIIILLGAIVVYNQLQYVRDAPLGFDKENVVVVHRAYALDKQKETFKRELLRHGNIKVVSYTNSLPGRHFEPNGHKLEGEPAYREHQLQTMSADYDFAKLLNLELVEGRFFSPEITTDTSAVIINEAAVKELALENPIGKRFIKEFDDAKPGEFVTITGVLKDYHYSSFHHKIQPMLLRNLGDKRAGFVSVRIAATHTKKSLDLIEGAWQKFSGGQPFRYSFLDTDLETLYRKDQRTGQIFGVFFTLAIFTACLGLFGLASYTAAQRTKEIGIRKILGASVREIVVLLSGEFSKWVLIANIIAWPTAYIIMNKWLQNFAYRQEMELHHFLLAGLLTLVIALLTVAFQSIKASLANPVIALKYE
ncbi:MAG: FtsX-like permease family protein [bacterium]|nr:FtsX-like permease family protein [bacterium]